MFAETACFYKFRPCIFPLELIQIEMRRATKKSMRWWKDGKYCGVESLMWNSSKWNELQSFCLKSFKNIQNENQCENLKLAVQLEQMKLLLEVLVHENVWKAWKLQWEDLTCKVQRMFFKSTRNAQLQHRFVIQVQKVIKSDNSFVFCWNLDNFDDFKVLHVRTKILIKLIS